MSGRSKIEWTECTWNPVTGCTKISQGCKNCYAEKMSKRLKLMGCVRYSDGFNVTLHEDLVGRPLKWRKPRNIFVNSMSDLFHNAVPDSFIAEIFETISLAHWHNFQVLTKRPNRAARLAKKLCWPSNLWMGVSVENRKTLSRIEELRKIPAKVKFLSLEPLLEDLGHLNLDNIDWVIVGGESGYRCRPIKEEWVVSLRKQCVDSDTRFFFKQWGGFQKKKNGRLLEGRTWDEMPDLV